MKKIIKYNDFLFEQKFNDTPESIVDTVLRKIKKELEELFEVDNTQIPGGTFQLGDAGFDTKVVDLDDTKLSFPEMGLNLLRVKINSYSKSNRSLDLRFADPDDNMYSLYLRIDISDAVSKNSKEMEPKLVKKGFIKFKKYDINGELVGTISRNVDDVWKLSENEELLSELKIELDGYDGSDKEDELVIET